MGHKRNSLNPLKDAKLRFWSYTKTGPIDQCWEYTGNKDNNGYGRVTIAGRKIRTHRFSYMLHHDLREWDITNIVIRHTCDNPSCVNPQHLLPGTRTDNHQDMVERLRHTIGERHPGSKLTADEVRSIRAIHATHTLNQREIAELFGVHGATVNDIILRKCWKHI